MLLPMFNTKNTVRFTGRDAVVALLGASSLLLFSHLYALRPSIFLLPTIHFNSNSNSNGDNRHSSTAINLPFLPSRPAQLDSDEAVPGRIDIAPPPTQGVTTSRLLSHAPGWTLMQNLYLSNGTWVIVSEDGGFEEGYWPLRRLITSTGLPGFLDNGPQREPTDQNMEIITFAEAEQRWGDRVWDVEGFSILVNDPDQFLKHYYHVAAELLFGTERMLTNFDPNPTPDGHASYPAPDRMIFMQCSEAGFTDGPRFNQFFLPAMYPSLTPMFKSTFDQFADLVRSSNKAFRFPAALFVDRSAAFRRDPTESTSRTPAGPWQLGGGAFGTGGEGRNQFWYESARRRVATFAGVPQHVLDIGLRARDPEAEQEPPVITYISRQKSRASRHLLDADHERLVVALEDVCRRKGWMLDVMYAEDLTREEQIQRVARTTVMIGVHGNGLTHQLLMPPHPQSTLIEIFYPGGFARDYEWTAGVLGRAYFGVQNDTFIAPPNLPGPSYPEGFHGTQIPVQPEVVVQILEERLEGGRGIGHWSGFEGVGY